MLILPRAVPVSARSSQSSSRNPTTTTSGALRLIKADVRALHCVWSSAESALRLERSPVTHPDGSPLLQSSVVDFLLSRLKSFPFFFFFLPPSTVAPLILFSVFSPKEIGLSFPLLSFSLPGRGPITGPFFFLFFHFCSPDAEWAKEDPRGAGIFYYSDIFEKFLGALVFLPLSRQNLRMLQHFCPCVCVCVCREWVKGNSSHKSKKKNKKNNSKLRLNDRLGAPVLWIVLFSIYSCSGWRGK